MHLPCRYPYDPRWRLIMVVLGIGAGLLGVGATNLVSLPFVGAIGATLVGGAFLLIVRRLAFPRSLELRLGELSLPTGFFQFRTAHVPYSEITGAREIFLPLTAVIRIATDGRGFDITSTLLKNAEAYHELRDFILNQRWQES